MPPSPPDVRVLWKDLAVSRARLAARESSILGDQVEIASIAAPTGAEQARARWLAARLATCGLDKVSMDRMGNVLGLRRGVEDEAPVVLCAHLDTVFDTDVPLEVKQRGKRVEAPGIGDNARGLAALLALASEFGTGGIRPRRPVIFAGTTCEEGIGDLRGARHLFDTAGSAAHAAIAIDGAGDERVVSCALGCRRYRVTYRGPGGHSWAAYGVANAVHAAAALVQKLSTLRISHRPRTTLTVSRIGGGKAINAVPAEGWIEVDMRSTSAVELSRLDRELHRAAREAGEEEDARRRSGTSPLTVTLQPLSDRPAGELPADSALVQAAVEATRAIGVSPELAIASTDANIPMSRGIPAIAIGGGGIGGETHTAQEWYEDRDGARGVVRALLVVAAMAGIA